MLKVDLNFLERTPVLPPRGRWLRHSLGDDLPTSTVPLLQFPELVATTLVALARPPCLVTLGAAQTDAARLLGRVLEAELGHLAFLGAPADGEIRPETLRSDCIGEPVRTNQALRWRRRVGAEAPKVR